MYYVFGVNEGIVYGNDFDIVFGEDNMENKFFDFFIIVDFNLNFFLVV